MSTYNCFFATHSHRLSCLLYNILKEHGSASDLNRAAIFKPNKEKIKKFKNCAILLLTATKNNVKLSMVHEGFDGNPENNDNSLDNPSRFKKADIQDIQINRNAFNIDANDNNIYNFYLIRHGEALHNTYKKTDKFLSFKHQRNIDTPLTQIGMIQANNVASSLLNIKIDYLFCSDLLRTRQTLSQILTARLTLQAGKMNAPNNIFVVPCSHELDSTGSDSCDGNQSSTLLTGENMTSCTLKNINLPECQNIGSYKINWKYYLNFYGGNTRSVFLTPSSKGGMSISPFTKKNKSIKLEPWTPTEKSLPENPAGRCRNTNMIKEAIQIITKEKVGGKRKKKTSKKNKTKKRGLRKRKKRHTKRKKTKHTKK
jgi:2,3-bisphosphoglycerate-dependent phosphoglycerate mutase